MTDIKVSPPAVVTKVEEEKNPLLVFHQLIMRNIDRSRKDIDDWRTAHRMAEAVMNPNRSKLIDLFEDVVLDGHLTGVWSKRVKGVVNKKLMFVKNKVEDESFSDLLTSKKFRQLRKKLMRMHAYGLVGVEFIPGAEFNWQEIPIKHIRPDKKMITIEVGGEKGFNYQDNPLLWVIENEDEPLGFLLKASPYVLFKKGNYADWAEFIEIFGQPVIVTKYDGHDEKTRVLLSNALDNAGSSLRLMLPKQAEFEMKDGKTSNGDGKLQDTFKTAMNNEISILVLGNTETTSNENGGSFAKGQVHADQQLEITKDDMAEELMLLNDKKFLTALKMYGFNTDGGRFEYETEVDNSKLKAELDIDEKLQRMGVPLNDDYFYEKYHRPKPANYEAMKAEKQQEKEAKRQLMKPGQPAVNPLKNDKKTADKKLTEKLRGLLADFFDPAP